MSQPPCAAGVAPQAAEEEKWRVRSTLLQVYCYALCWAILRSLMRLLLPRQAEMHRHPRTILRLFPTPRFRVLAASRAAVPCWFAKLCGPLCRSVHSPGRKSAPLPGRKSAPLHGRKSAPLHGRKLVRPPKAMRGSRLPAPAVRTALAAVMASWPRLTVC